MDYRELFRLVHQRPGMYGVEGSFATCTAFIRGCEAGNDWQLLAGFREWLVTRCGAGHNLSWEALVLRQAFPGRPLPRAELKSDPEVDRIAVDTLFRLLDEFLERRDAHGGLAEIFDDYLNRTES